jgi:hypothetical protein
VQRLHLGARLLDGSVLAVDQVAQARGGHTAPHVRPSQKRRCLLTAVLLRARVVAAAGEPRLRPVRRGASRPERLGRAGLAGALARPWPRASGLFERLSCSGNDQTTGGISSSSDVGLRAFGGPTAARSPR